MRRVLGTLLVVLAAVAAPAGAASLPEVSSGHRPGPDVLYEGPPRAPQLENTGVWDADPILVSGATAYREGEFLYQDFLYDDHGAAGARDPEDPYGPGDYLFSPRTGTYLYPTDPVYANNAADLVELRAKPVPGGTAFRLTLNTLQDAEKVGATIAIGTSGEPRAWPHGAGIRSPAELFLTWHGSSTELLDTTSGAARTPAPRASVDVERRQVTITVPHEAWDPGTAKVRLAAGVGLWDAAAGEYLAVGAAPSATAPGGAATSGARIVNLAFRGFEPMPAISETGLGLTIGDAAGGAAVQATWWREKAQAEALAGGDVSAFFAEADFGKLVTRTDDESAVPRVGPMSRIFASARVFAQGVDFGKLCGGLQAAISDYAPCEGSLQGQLQPYALYVPDKPQPAGGWGLTLLLHSLSANYNQYLNSKNQSQLGERGAGSLVATPAGRGPDGFYRDVAEADMFEVWADVARHYSLDPSWTVVSGYSMGGLGTFRMLSRWPELFARGFSVVGSGSPNENLASLRNTPIMSWAATGDELVNINSTEATTNEMVRLGLRFRHLLFVGADHLTLATNDEYGIGADFLGEHRIDLDPPHVTYVIDPETDSQRAGTIADHSYWLSGLRVAQGAERGTIDVRSEGFGVGDAPVLGVKRSQGAMEGGSHGPMPYDERSQEWGEAPAAARADRLVVKATGVAAATVDARRARVSCAPGLEVASDGPLDLRIACAPAKPRRCAKRVRVKLPRFKGRRVRRVVVRRGGKVLVRRRGRNLRRIVVRRPTRGAFTLRVRVRTGGKRPRTVTLVRRYRRCG